MMVLPHIESYPKTVLLRDRSKVVIRPLEEGDKVRLLTRSDGIFYFHDWITPGRGGPA